MAEMVVSYRLSVKYGEGFAAIAAIAIAKTGLRAKDGKFYGVRDFAFVYSWLKGWADMRCA